MFPNYLSQLNINKTIRLLALGLSLTLHAGLMALLFVSGFEGLTPANFVTVELLGGSKEVINNLPQKPKPTSVTKKKVLTPMSQENSDTLAASSDSPTTNVTSTASNTNDSYQLDQYLGNVSGTPDPRSIYFTKIFKQISSVKSYPAMARQLSIQGQVKLLLQISSEGEVLEMKALEYDHEILKQASLDAIKKAGKFEKPPFQIHGSSFSLIIPLRYQIK